MTARKGRATKGNHAHRWEKLSWDDLTEWAGSRSVSRGRKYQRSGRVKDLGLAEYGRLLAWVDGRIRYATTVELAGGRGKRSRRLQSRCTCPVGFSGCKHAVAVVLDYLSAYEEGREVPAAAGDDPRWQRIHGAETIDAPLAAEPRSTARQSKADLEAFVRAKPQEELADLVLKLAERYGDFRRALSEEAALAGGQHDRLVRQARDEIEQLTSEDAWSNPWRDEGHIPDYSGLESRLARLVDHGQADAVLGLGKALLEGGIRQIETSHDEGETAAGIAGCMAVVFRALLESARADEEKLLYAIDAVLCDDYDLCCGANKVLDRRWPKATWSALADRLAERLAGLAVPHGDTDWPGSYRRDSLSNWVIAALDHAGRAEEALGVCRSEARETGSYGRLVRRLIEAGELAEARQWAEEGIRKTRWPGVAGDLNALLGEIARRQKDWGHAAAVVAGEFFSRPSVPGLRELLKAAGKARCRDAVEPAAMRFLETGIRPDRADAGGRPRKARGSDWPLPPLPRPAKGEEPFAQRPSKPRPHYAVLIDLAIQEKRPDDVLKWYDQQRTGRSAGAWLGGQFASQSLRIAKAVEASHPDRAVEIYYRLADARAATKNVGAYPDAGLYLKNARRVLQREGRSEEWDQLLARFRDEHGRKWRLMQIVDETEEGPIVKKRAGRRTRRRL